MMATQAHVRPIQLKGHAQQRVGRIEHIARAVLVQLSQTRFVFPTTKLTL